MTDKVFLNWFNGTVWPHYNNISIVTWYGMQHSNCYCRKYIKYITHFEYIKGDKLWGVYFQYWEVIGKNGIILHCINGYLQDCNISIALAEEKLQSCAKPLIYTLSIKVHHSVILLPSIFNVPWQHIIALAVASAPQRGNNLILIVMIQQIWSITHPLMAAFMTQWVKSDVRWFLVKNNLCA